MRPFHFNKTMRYSLLIICLSVLSILSGTAQSITPVTIELDLFASGFSDPVGLYNAGDDRMFVVEQDAGHIEILNSDGSAGGQFLNVSSFISNGSERGLLGLAFHPDYQNNGLFYINYTNGSGDTVVAEYEVSGDPDVADASSAAIIITIDQPAGNHNGGHIAFGNDGYLYIGLGDGGGQGDPNNLSQNGQELLGKMLRIDIDGGSPYAIPADNPFVGDPTVLDEIWSIGLRNPWKYSFDAVTGDLWIGDVGQNAWEEVNFQSGSNTGGDNYGWRCYEGDDTYNTNQCGPIGDYVLPVSQISHSNPDSWCSITGGLVYRGTEFPAMVGTYFFTDYCAGDFKALVPNGGGFDEIDVLPGQGFGYVAFGENNNGDLFAVNLNGNIMKINDSCGDFSPVLSVTGQSLTTGVFTDTFWYLDGQEIDGAAGNTYLPTTSGSYSLLAENAEGCVRSSNSIDWTVLGGVLGCTYEEASNFQDDATLDDGSCLFGFETVCPEDIDNDGVVGTGDLLLMLGAFGSFCQ
ncbi:MAG: PQQ-dependent sugar dehydrogenase [Flavobacteriales bacterium]|nr:PQQ-dependent sugar dehydrogenase [Flavobacteriales bacterium]